MKKIILTLLLFSIQMFGQDKVTTTQEEYNYLTIGYPESIEKGLGIKPGYTLQKIDEETFVRCTIELYAFKEIESGNTKAYLIKRINKEKPKKTRFYCLPINNKELLGKYSYDSSNEPIMLEYMITLSKLLVKSLEAK